MGGIQAESLIQQRLATREIESEANRRMKDQTREPWMDLCEQAAVEEDSVLGCEGEADHGREYRSS